MVFSNPAEGGNAAWVVLSVMVELVDALFDRCLQAAKDIIQSVKNNAGRFLKNVFIIDQVKIGECFYCFYLGLTGYYLPFNCFIRSTSSCLYGVPSFLKTS